MQREVRNIIKLVAKKTGVSETKAEEIVMSQLKLVKETMAKGEKGKPDTYQNIMLPYLGKFVAKKGRIEKLHEQKEKRNNKGKSS